MKTYLNQLFVTAIILIFSNLSFAQITLVDSPEAEASKIEQRTVGSIEIECQITDRLTDNVLQDADWVLKERPMYLDASGNKVIGSLADAVEITYGTSGKPSRVNTVSSEPLYTLIAYADGYETVLLNFVALSKNGKNAFNIGMVPSNPSPTELFTIDSMDQQSRDKNLEAARSDVTSPELRAGPAAGAEPALGAEPVLGTGPTSRSESTTGEPALRSSCSYTAPASIWVSNLHNGYNGTTCSGSGFTGYIPLDDYIAGVVAAEMGSSFPQEALKAQAIAARTYSLYRDNVGLCANGGQAYTSAIPSSCQAAADATSSKVITYGGSLVETNYAARCNGDVTQNANEGTWYGCSVSGSYVGHQISRPCSGHINCLSTTEPCCTVYTPSSGSYRSIYGHGVGMCQRGAQGFAGGPYFYDHEDILEAFYTGICITGGSAPPSGFVPNDDPCNATNLTVGSSCSYTTGTNSGATGSGVTPYPLCDGPFSASTRDVWYTFTMPASGVVEVLMSAGTINDVGAQIFSGSSCSSLSYVGCDPNGSTWMPEFGLTGSEGTDVYIRIWEYNDNNTGTFNICVVDPCSYSLSSYATSAPDAGGSYSFFVDASSSDCDWDATSGDSWIVLGSGSSGDGTFNFSVQPNTSSSTRTGVISIMGEDHYINQAAAPIICLYTLCTSYESVGSDETTLSCSVTPTYASCSWNVSSPDFWITNISPGFGSGSGSFNYTVLENTTTSARTGTIIVEDQTITVFQAAAPVSCSYTLSTSYESVGSDETTLSCSVNASDASCSWNVSSPDFWITNFSPGFGSGSGSLNYTVLENTSTAARTGTINVEGQTITVFQAAADCNYALDNYSTSAPAALTNVTVNVSTTAACTWTASTSDAWISAPTAPTTGSGSLTFTVDENTGSSPRVGTVNIGGEVHTVTQAGVTVTSCPFTLSSSLSYYNNESQIGTVEVFAADPTCEWTAFSTDPWIDVLTSTGLGTSTIVYQIMENTSGADRAGTVNVSGSLHTVIQSVGTGIEALEQSINIYPIPASQWLTIEFGEINVSSIELYAASGQLLKNDFVANAQTHRLDLADFANGIYFLKIISNQGSLTKPIQIHR